VDGIEALRLRLREVLEAHGAHREAGLFDPRQDPAGQPPLDGIRFDDCECPFHIPPAIAFA
jgi:hypothetical protein